MYMKNDGLPNFQWKICKTEFLKFDQNLRNFELFEVFLKNSIFLDISPKTLWMDVVSIQKVRKNKTSLIKGYLDKKTT